MNWGATAIRSRPARGAGTGWHWGAPIAATLAVLELTGSEQPELPEFQAHVLRNSTMSFAVQQLAAELEVQSEEIGPTVGRACRDLDRLEKQRGAIWQPEQVLDRPNLAALLYVCRARMRRVAPRARRLRLERIRRRVEAAHKLRRTRIWIEDFIGPQGGVSAGSEAAE